MKKASDQSFEKTAYSPVLFTTYKVLKKIGKYSLYIAIAYFAIEGFMAWE